jgi:hypothetical protein
LHWIFALSIRFINHRSISTDVIAKLGGRHQLDLIHGELIAVLAVDAILGHDSCSVKVLPAYIEIITSRHAGPRGNRKNSFN